MALSTRTVSAVAAAAIALTVGISTVSGQTATEPQPGAAGRRHAFGQGRPGGPGGPGGFLPLRRLELTDDQRAQIKEILQAARPAGDDAPGRQLMTLRRSLRAAILADTPDASQIEQIRSQIAQAEAAALAKRVDVGLKIAQVLTPEQREKARTAAPGRRRTH
jgi:Spy/CpxP family protein refolding chaperone